MIEAGILESSVGKVGLLYPDELPNDWDPQKDKRFTIWVATHHMIRVLEQGEFTAAEIMAKLGSSVENARELTYWLYHMCEQKGYVKESQDCNRLVQSWPEISRLTRDTVSSPTLLGGGGVENA